MQNNIMAAGLRDRSLMLATRRYSQYIAFLSKKPVEDGILEAEWLSLNILGEERQGSQVTQRTTHVKNFDRQVEPDHSVVGCPITEEERDGLNFRIDIVEAENASLRARNKTTEAIEKITRNCERQAREKMERHAIEENHVKVATVQPDMGSIDLVKQQIRTLGIQKLKMNEFVEPKVQERSSIIHSNVPGAIPDCTKLCLNEQEKSRILGGNGATLRGMVDSMSWSFRHFKRIVRIEKHENGETGMQKGWVMRLRRRKSKNGNAAGTRTHNVVTGMDWLRDVPRRIWHEKLVQFLTETKP
ncbi:hypothetical protein Tco_0598383 [Tanacetum coccineum]